MELIRRNTGYGLRALLEMARQPRDRSFTAEELADAAGTTEDFMHKIMGSLREARIVAAKRGPSGGFRLAVEPGDLTLLDVVNAIQGPIGVNRCVLGLKECTQTEHCPLGRTWRRIQGELEHGLASTTLGEMAGTVGGAALTECAEW